MSTTEVSLDELWAEVRGAGMAATAASHRCHELAVAAHRVELRRLAEAEPELVALRLGTEWQSDHGVFFESVWLTAEYGDERQDDVGEVTLWSPEAARELFEVTEEVDRARLTRDQILGWDENPPNTSAVRAGVEVTLTTSGGSDGAPVVFVDTDVELVPDGPQGPEMRILLNDEPVFEGRPYVPCGEELGR